MRNKHCTRGVQCLCLYDCARAKNLAKRDFLRLAVLSLMTPPFAALSIALYRLDICDSAALVSPDSTAFRNDLTSSRMVRIRRKLNTRLFASLFTRFFADLVIAIVTGIIHHMSQNAIDAVFATTKRHRYEKNQMIILYVVTFFIVAALGFYALPNLKLATPLDNLYLQMVIFLFATLVGFSISRQNSRYREIIKELTSFDGGITAMYREFGTFDKEYQDRFEQIAREHYYPIIENRRWDHNLVNKSSTLSNTYDLIDELSVDRDFSDVERMSASNIRKILSDMQRNRKDLVALHAERVQDFLWFVIYFLCLILIITIASVSSYGLMLESILKSAFTTTVVATAVMLRRLDNLELFESFVGEKSAKDILDIFDGKR